MARRGKESEKKASRHVRATSEADDDDSDGDSDSDSHMWKHIEDPAERRKVQNRLAQRKFRSKAKAEKEAAALHRQNQAAARSAYTQPDPDELDDDNHHSGLPWGSLSTRHVVAGSRARQEQQRQRTQEEEQQQQRVVTTRTRPQADEPYTLFERTVRRPVASASEAVERENMGPPERPARSGRHERGGHAPSSSQAEERERDSERARARAREERHRR